MNWDGYHINYRTFKERVFHMKLKKAALILGISICLVAGQIHVTYGLEQTDPSEQRDTEHADGQSDKEKDKDKKDSSQKTYEDETSEKNVQEPGQENPGAENTDGNESGGQNSEDNKTDGSQGDVQNPDGGKNDENQGNIENPDDGKNDGDQGNAEKPDDGKTDGDQGNVEKPDDGKNDGDQGNVEKPDDGKTDGDQGNAEKPDDGKNDGDQGNAEKPDDGKTDGDQGNIEKPDDGKTDGDQSNVEKPDDGKTDEDQGNVEKPDDGNTDGDQNEEEKPDDGKTDSDIIDKEEPGDDENGTEGGAVQTPPSDNSGVSNDTYEAPETGGSFTDTTVNSYSASIRFLDDSEKIKYNVSVPIKGLPSFITQEMIVAALKCQDETGYPASVTIAQIIQESGFGQYGPGGEDGKGLSYLAYQYNNLFGIKGTGPAGSVDMITGEQSKDGSLYTIVSGFRVYDTYTECIEDRTELLKEVYLDLTLGVNDANTFAMKIGSRWATSLTYGQSLIRQMEEYDLYRLDNMTLGEFSSLLGTFVNPCPGAVLSSDFGSREEPIAGAGTYHKGIDLGTGTYNIPTYAAASGTVTYAGEAGTAGNLIIIDHGNGLVTKYMHHEKVFVEEGQKVEKGQQIGLSGTTGQSTGNHLHFQVEEHGTAVDPFQYFTEKQKDSFYK